MKKSINIKTVYFLFLISLTACTSFIKHTYFSGSSLDGHYAVFGNRKEGKVTIKELGTDRVVKKWGNDIFDVIGGSVGFTGDSRYFILPVKKNIELWNLEKGSRDRIFTAQAVIYSAVTDLRNRYLAASDLEGGINIWDLDRLRFLGRIVFKENSWESFADKLVFSNDGEYLVAGSYGIIKVYSIPSGLEKKQFLTCEPYALRSIDISDNNAYIMASVGDKSIIKMWHLWSGELLWSREEKNWIFKIFFYHDDKYACTISTDVMAKAAASNEYTIKVWDVKSGRLVVTKKIKDFLNLNPDGRIFTWNPSYNQMVTYLWGGAWIEEMSGIHFNPGMDKIMEKIKTVKTEMMGNSLKRLAIAELESQSQSKYFQNFEQYFIEELISGFSSLEDFSMVEKSLFDRALKEIGSSFSDIVNPLSGKGFSPKITALGLFQALTGADAIFFSTFEDMRSKIKINSFLLNLKTAEIYLVINMEMVKDKNILKLMKQNNYQNSLDFPNFTEN